MSRPQSRYVVVNAQSPEGAGQCDRCGEWWQLRRLTMQHEWSGTHIYSLGILVCPHCLDVPNEQLRSIILPPDPLPLLNARVPNFHYEEQTVLIAQFGGTGQQPKPVSQPPWAAGPQLLLCEQTGEVPLIMQYLTSS
jgi:hypothetical protein